MPIKYKKTRKYNRKNKRKTRHQSRRRNKRRVLTAGNGDQVQCSICEKIVNKDNTLVPNTCLLKHGKRAHRICKDCWWNPTTGFGREDASHKCPGCEKGLPLIPYEVPEPVYIDLTQDSDDEK